MLYVVAKPLALKPGKAHVSTEADRPALKEVEVGWLRRPQRARYTTRWTYLYQFIDSLAEHGLDTAGS
jgi:hypothetical protein